MENTTAPKRPVFLTVLCILTWINNGIKVLLILIGLVAAGFISGALSEYAMVPVDSGVSTIKSIILLITYGGAIFGAILMWQLKKIGFFIYVASVIISLIVAFGIISLIFTILFLILYYLNYKHLE